MSADLLPGKQLLGLSPAALPLSLCETGGKASKSLAAVKVYRGNGQRSYTHVQGSRGRTTSLGSDAPLPVFLLLTSQPHRGDVWSPQELETAAHQLGFSSVP